MCLGTLASSCVFSGNAGPPAFLREGGSLVLITDLARAPRAGFFSQRWRYKGFRALGATGAHQICSTDPGALCAPGSVLEAAGNQIQSCSQHFSSPQTAWDVSSLLLLLIPYWPVVLTLLISCPSTWPGNMSRLEGTSEGKSAMASACPGPGPSLPQTQTLKPPIVKERGH